MIAELVEGKSLTAICAADVTREADRFGLAGTECRYPRKVRARSGRLNQLRFSRYFCDL
jgi:hypothetical protein